MKIVFLDMDGVVARYSRYTQDPFEESQSASVLEGSKKSKAKRP